MNNYLFTITTDIEKRTSFKYIHYTATKAWETLNAHHKAIFENDVKTHG